MFMYFLPNLSRSILPPLHSEGEKGCRAIKNCTRPAGTLITQLLKAPSATRTSPKFSFPLNRLLASSDGFLHEHRIFFQSGNRFGSYWWEEDGAVFTCTDPEEADVKLH